MNKNKLKLGDLLVQAEAITADQLQQALKYQQESGGKLGSTLINLGFITEQSLLDSLSRQLKIPFADLSNFNIDPEIVKKIPERIARRFRVVALEKQDDKYVVGMVEPTDVLAFDQATKVLGPAIKLVLVTESGLLHVVDHVYRRTEDIASFARELKDE